MNHASRDVLKTTDHKSTRRSLAPLLGSAVIAVAALGVATPPAPAQVFNACTSARIRLASSLRALDEWHSDPAITGLRELRARVLDDQLAVLAAC